MALIIPDVWFPRSESLWYPTNSSRENRFTKGDGPNVLLPVLEASSGMKHMSQWTLGLEFTSLFNTPEDASGWGSEMLVTSPFETQFSPEALVCNLI